MRQILLNIMTKALQGRSKEFRMWHIFTSHGSVVQRMDNTMQMINNYPLDSVSKINK